MCDEEGIRGRGGDRRDGVEEEGIVFSGITGLELAVLDGVDAVECGVEGVVEWTAVVVLPALDAIGLFERDGSEECVAPCLPGNLDQNPSLLLMIAIPSRLLVWLSVPSLLFSFFFSFSSFSFLFFSSFWELFTFPLPRPPLSFLTRL